MIKLKKLVKEIGDATMLPYVYSRTYNQDVKIEYTIKIKDNINVELKLLIWKVRDISELPTEYETEFISNKISSTTYGNINDFKRISIEFDLDTNSEEYLDNQSEKFNKQTWKEGFLTTQETIRFMSTIVKILKEVDIEFKKKYKYYFYEFSAIKSNKEKEVNSDDSINLGRRGNLYMVYLKHNLPSDWNFEKIRNIIMFYPPILKKVK